MLTPFDPADLEQLALYAGAIRIHTTGRETAALGTMAAQVIAEFLERAQRDIDGCQPFFTHRDAEELGQIARLLDHGLPMGSWDNYSEASIGRMALCRDVSSAAKRVMRTVQERIN